MDISKFLQSSVSEGSVSQLRIKISSFGISHDWFRLHLGAHWLIFKMQFYNLIWMNCYNLWGYWPISMKFTFTENGLDAYSRKLAPCSYSLKLANMPFLTRFQSNSTYVRHTKDMSTCLGTKMPHWYGPSF